MTNLTPAGFNALPRNQKAVLVATDVIEQLNARVYVANQGRYLAFSSKQGFRVGPETLKKDARQCLIDQEFKCTVCAKGALFLSTIRFKNQLTVEQGRSASFNTRDSMVLNVSSYPLDISKVSAFDLMLDIFPIETLTSMETIFEEVVGMKGEPREYLALLKSEMSTRIRYGEKADYLMRRIMQNIIDNNGDFIMSKS